MKSRFWWVYGLVAVCLGATYFLAGGAAARVTLLVPLELGTAAVMLLGVRLHRPEHRLPWVLLAAGLASFAVGDAIAYGYPAVTGVFAPSPSWYDLFYLASYALVVPALVLLVRHRCGAERRSLIDAMTFTTGLGLPVWVLLVLPTLRDGEASAGAQLIAVAYPLADLTVLAVLTRLWFSPGARPVAFLLLGAGMVPLLVSDVVYGAEIIAGTWTIGTWVDGGWMLWVTCWGMAATHPSMTATTDGAARPAGLTPLRATSLAAAALVAPGVLVIQGLRGDSVDVGPIAAAFVVLTALVVARVADLVQELTESDARQRGQERFRALVQGGSDLITLLSPDGVVTYQSPSVERLLGVPAEDLVDTPLADVVHPDDRSRLAAHLAASLAGSKPGSVELRLRAADGTSRWVETLGGNLVGDGSERGVVLTSRDVTERRSLEEQLTRQALHDPLTGLANRRLFADRVKQALARRGDGQVAVLFIDLDDFKTVNDSLGHAAGDALLTEVGRRLTGLVRAGDSVARLGGDEFALLLEDEVTDDTGERLAERVVRALREPARLGNTEVVPRASLGVASAPTGSDHDELLRNADLAMYMAKGGGGSRYEVFHHEMYAATVGRLELVADLRRALEREEFRLHFQPTVRIETGTVTGVEALVRWEHPTRGLVAPGAFIPLAEETGLIVPMSRWILAQACTQAGLWPVPPGGRPVTVAVNLSPRHLADPSVVDDVALALAESGLDPARLVLEITETGLLADGDEMVAILQSLKALGVRLAVDDFGTGYSSLSYLRRFPVDILKVDKSFVDGLGLDGEATALVRAILDMAQSMNMTTVAEGIEEGHQLSELAALGCDLGQGFLLSRPLPADRLVGLLADPRLVAELVRA
ncbi:MAG: EAL domain-containing protein [Actinomycetota bacterium]|nr:EAL domain-containing protein [Actinomycetota bacterium]